MKILGRLSIPLSIHHWVMGNGKQQAKRSAAKETTQVKITHTKEKEGKGTDNVMMVSHLKRDFCLMETIQKFARDNLI